jgi:prepilin-type N-terminal cleavage/methylation domain-containing protein
MKKIIKNKIIKNKKGFTLTELIIVVAILGLLAAVATPSLLSYIEQGKEGADTANLAILNGVIARNLASGNLQVALNATANDLKTALEVIDVVNDEVDIPTPKIAAVGEKFVYNTTTGKVTIAVPDASNFALH